LARKVGSRRLHHQAKSNEATSIRASRPDKEVRTYQTGCDLRTAALLPTQPNDADLNAREQDPPGLDPEPPGRLGRLKEKPRGGSGKHAQRLRERKLVASHRTPRTLRRTSDPTRIGRAVRGRTGGQPGTTTANKHRPRRRIRNRGHAQPDTCSAQKELYDMLRPQTTCAEWCARDAAQNTNFTYVIK